MTPIDPTDDLADQLALSLDRNLNDKVQSIRTQIPGSEALTTALYDAYFPLIGSASRAPYSQSVLERSGFLRYHEKYRVVDWDGKCTSTVVPTDRGVKCAVTFKIGASTDRAVGLSYTSLLITPALDIEADARCSYRI
jgi:hypothetical protein